jgi:hypothetical protein
MRKEGRAGIRAQNMLSFHYGFDYFREAILPELSAQGNAEEESAKPKIATALWDAYPNPATSEVIIQYAIPEKAKNPILLVHDSNGKIVLQQKLDPANIQYLWEVTSLERGVYFYTLKYHERIQQTKQILLMR